MQGNNYGLLENDKKFPKSPFRPDRRVLTFNKHQIIWSSSCQVFEWTVIELAFTLQHDREFVTFRFYFPLFIKLLLWALKASDIYSRHFENSYVRDVSVRLKTTRAMIKIARGTTNNKINKIRWNMYRDNNFHSRRQVLRVMRLWKSWAR